LTPLRSLPCASRTCPSYQFAGFDTRKLNAPPVTCALREDEGIGVWSDEIYLSEVSLSVMRK
jgi:hypothetical protein